MENLSIKVGDTVQHLKRGSCYRILSKKRFYANDMRDGETRCLISQRGGMNTSITLKDAAEAQLPLHDVADFQIVMLQIDEESKSKGDTTTTGGIYMDFLIYEAIEVSDGGPRVFMRPVVEFTADRFRKIGDFSPMGLVSKMLTEDMREKLIESWYSRPETTSAPCDVGEFYATAFLDQDILELCRLIAGDDAPDNVIQSYFDLMNQVRKERDLPDL